MRQWTRLWHDMPTDPKWRVVAKRSGRPLAEVIAVFSMMLTSASDEGHLNGWANDDVAAALDLEPEHVEAVIAAMQGKVLDGDKLTGWTKRQPKREDDSRQRVREHRERKKQQRNDAEDECNADVTQRNAPEKKRKEKKREEIDIGVETLARSESGAAREDGADGRTAAYGDLKRMFNGSTEAMVEFVTGTMGPGTRPNAEQWLASTVSAHGQQAVAQAFAMLVEKQAAGVVIARPLGHWSTLAKGLRAGHQLTPGAPKKRTLSDVLAERRAAEAKEAAQ